MPINFGGATMNATHGNVTCGALLLQMFAELGKEPDATGKERGLVQAEKRVLEKAWRALIERDTKERLSDQVQGLSG